MKILDSELPRNANGVATKGGWRVHSKAGRDITDGTLGRKKRRRRRDMGASNKISAVGGAVGPEGFRGRGGWVDPNTWMADAWRECVDMEEPEEDV